MAFFRHALNRFDTDALIKRLEEKPQLYFQMMNCYANLMQASLQHQKLEFTQKQAEAKQREREQKLHARKPILVTGSTLDNLNRTLIPSGRHQPSDARSSRPQESSTSNTGGSENIQVHIPPQSPCDVQPSAASMHLCLDR